MKRPLRNYKVAVYPNPDGTTTRRRIFKRGGWYQVGKGMQVRYAADVNQVVKDHGGWVELETNPNYERERQAWAEQRWPKKENDGLDGLRELFRFSR